MTPEQRELRRQKQREYRAANKDKVREWRRRYREKLGDVEFKARKRASHERHREEIAARNRLKYATDPTKKREQILRWRDNNPEQVADMKKSHYEANKQKYKDAARLRALGISREQVDAMLLSQDNKCPLCDRAVDVNSHADHCHATGKFRGMLCHKCNPGLGLFEDNPARLRRAANYLESFK